MKPIMSISKVREFKLVKFELPGGVTTPEDFEAAVREIEKDLSGQEPVLINGRGPVWGYGMLIHAAHATPAVGTFDPRLGGYVVVASHDAKYRVGQVIPDPDPS